MSKKEKIKLCIVLGPGKKVLCELILRQSALLFDGGESALEMLFFDYCQQSLH